MKVVTAEQMRRIDRIAIEDRGVPGTRLMEQAGQALAEKIGELVEPCRVAVVAGKGNNAGDGFVVARHLVQQNYGVTVLLLADPAEFRGDAKTMHEAIPESVTQVRIEDEAQLSAALKDFDLIVDAVLGTGVQGPVRGFFGEAIEAINASARPVVSVDIPSGLPADGGPIEGPVTRASHTVTMGLPKLGMLIQPGVEYTGTVTVASLDFPEDLLNDPHLRINLLTEKMIKAFLPPRPPDGHKGTFGSVLVVGGSPGMTGAPVMASRAAMRSGAGLVFCASAEDLQPQIVARLLEELTIALPSTDGVNLDLESMPALRLRATQVRAMALGPGIGQSDGTVKFVRKAVEEIQLPMVIDADALNALGGHLDVLTGREAPTILTPHPGEMSRLTGLSVSEIQANRIGVAQKLAAAFPIIVVLKGAQTIIADVDGSAYINPTGNTGLAKGGSGDVLTGLIGGLLAQTRQGLPSALCGVFLHGLAADLAADTIPPRAMIASDVIEHLPKAFREISKA
jgi:NAD(P)H-hydrate epimerase